MQNGCHDTARDDVCCLQNPHARDGNFLIDEFVEKEKVIAYAHCYTEKTLVLQTAYKMIFDALIAGALMSLNRVVIILL